MEADRLKTVMRRSRIHDRSRFENTAEHSWHLALFAMTLEGWALAPVEIGRVIRMLILHDLVEMECGDTPLYDAAHAATQTVREQEAAAIVFGLLPPDQGADFRALWEEFEAAETAEAKFAKALDRLQPILLNHATEGGTWLDFDVDIARAERLSGRIVHGSPILWEAARAVFADAVARGWLRAAPREG